MTIGDGDDVRAVWKRASGALFTELARDGGLARGARGVALRGPDSWAAVVCLHSRSSTAAELRLSFELRVWLRWTSDLAAFRMSAMSPFPPVRDWQRATDTSVFWARWNELEHFPGPRVPEWIGVRAGGVGDLVALLREKLADLRPRLERVADSHWLVDRWVEGLDDPDAWWPTLLDLAVTAHGLGDEALRDRVLARLAGVDDEYWSGAELVDVVRRWMRTPAAGR